jgi:1-acyl-sn-glycerol-3-phosphate acyltransferase
VSSSFPLLTRDALVAAILAFFEGYDARVLAAIRATVEREVDAVGSDGVRRLGARLAEDDEGWTYHPPDRLARRLHHALADLLLPAGSALFGAAYVAAIGDAPAIVLGNHLSYSDANLLEVLLHRSGCEDLASRLTAMAGPKVYSSRKRRFSSLCFGTIKTPQNAGVSSGEAAMHAREVARAARQVIQMAHQRLGAGDALVLYAEGTRSRTGEMQRHLSGAARYLEGPPARILPIGMTGTEAMFPIDSDTLRPVRVVARVGPPIDTPTLYARTGGDRRFMMDVLGVAIARLLPPPYRGAYADDVPGLDEAKRVFDTLGR